MSNDAEGPHIAIAPVPCCVRLWRAATLLCDGIIVSRGTIDSCETCDAPLCEHCTERIWCTLEIHTGDTWDCCPVHAGGRTTAETIEARITDAEVAERRKRIREQCCKAPRLAEVSGAIGQAIDAIEAHRVATGTSPSHVTMSRLSREHLISEMIAQGYDAEDFSDFRDGLPLWSVDHAAMAMSVEDAKARCAEAIADADAQRD